MKLAPHKNSVTTVIVSLEHPFQLDFGSLDSDAHIDRYMAVVPSGTLHHLSATGLMLFLYLDPLEDRPQMGREGHSPNLDQVLRRSLIAALEPTEDPAVQIDKICDLLAIPRLQTKNASFRQGLRAVDLDPASFPSVKHAADRCQLSVGRFQHVMREETGLSFRRYRIWRRMEHVARLLNIGENLTFAALGAGFSSSAHLSSTFRAMFGIRPTDLLANGARFDVSRLEPLS